MGKQEDFVLRALEERDVRFVRLWFTDVLGFLKSVAVAPAELEGAFAEGIGFDGSAIEGFARVYEADMLAKPDPSTFQILPWRGEGPSTARMFCDIEMPDGSAVVRRPAARAQADPVARRPRRASPSTRTPRSSSTSSRTPRSPASSRCRWTAAATSTTPRSRWAPTSAARRSRCSRRWASRSSSATTRAARASRRSTCGTPTRSRTADNIMTFRTVIREVALSQGIWATFMPKPFTDAPRLRHAHPRLAVRGRPQRVLRGRRGVPALQDRPAVHRRHPQARPRDQRGHQPVGEQLQADDVRRRGAVVHLLGPQQPLGDDPGPDVQAATRASRPASSCAPSTPPATPTWRSPSCWPPA